jgi:hypothetical protein
VGVNVAFVVGCTKYENPGISKLEFANEDASSVARVLHQQCGVPTTYLFLFEDNSVDSRMQPRRNNVIRELAAPLHPQHRLTTSIEHLFFFFSGHGFHSQVDDKDYLLFQRCRTVNH